jgi:hypothetical protein
MKRVLPLAAMAMAASCHDQATSGAEAPSVREVDGIALVQNLGPARAEGAADEVLSTTWRVEGDDRDGGSGVWEEPVRVRFADDRVYVLDRMADRVYVIGSRDGEPTHTFGRSGEGPGEFMQSFGLAVDGTDIVVGDGSKASLEFFDREGAHVGSLRVGRLMFGLHALGSRSFLVNGLSGSEGGWAQVLEDGGAEPFVWPDWMTPLEAEDDCFRVAADRDAVYRVRCVDIVYQVLTHDGDVVREVTARRPPVAASEQALQGHLHEVRRTMAESGLRPELIERQVAREEERLRVVPAMRGIRRDPVTGDVAVWEQHPEELGPSEAILHLFDARGHHKWSATSDASGSTSTSRVVGCSHWSATGSRDWFTSWRGNSMTARADSVGLRKCA